MRSYAIALILGLVLAGCSRDDRQRSSEPPAREAGRDAYHAAQELKHGAKEAAEEARKAGKEFREGWNEARHDSHDRQQPQPGNKDRR